MLKIFRDIIAITKNFDISTATMKLTELDKYISTGHVEEGKSSHTVIAPFSNKK